MKEKNIEILKTIHDWIRWGSHLFQQAHLFFGHGTDNAADEALLLVMFVTGLSHEAIQSFLSCRLSIEEKTALFALFQKRIETRKPAAYLTHTAYFGGFSFYVDERVLVPRSPIAELIEQQFSPWIKNPEKIHRVLDLCTGSGCIGLLSALYLENTQVDLVDISSDALAVAEKNRSQWDLSDRVKLIQSDVFDAITPENQYDLIISNPPYVSQREYDELPVEYHQEPALGLVAADDGLAIVKRILRQAASYLSADGILIVEVGYTQDTLITHFPSVPFTWLHFERGGEGVFLLTKKQLVQYID